MYPVPSPPLPLPLVCCCWPPNTMRGPTSSSGASPSTTINKGEKRRGKRVLAESLVLIEVAQYEVEGEGEGEREGERRRMVPRGEISPYVIKLMTSSLLYFTRRSHLASWYDRSDTSTMSTRFIKTILKLYLSFRSPPLLHPPFPSPLH